MSPLYQYLSAFFGNWLLYMTAGPFLADELLQRWRPKWRDKIARLIPAKARKRIEVVLLLLGVFWAGFAAFQEEHAARETAETALTKIKTSSPVPFQFEVNQTDAQARKQIEDLQRELTSTKAALQNAIETGQSDSLDKPLLSARFFIVLKRKQDESKKEKPSSVTIMVLARALP